MAQPMKCVKYVEEYSIATNWIGAVEKLPSPNTWSFFCDFVIDSQLSPFSKVTLRHHKVDAGL